MLDKKTDAVLQSVAKLAGSGYTVLEKQQILQSLPTKYHADMENLCSILSFLKENGYVDVKYQDKESICLAVTVKAQNQMEGLKDTAGAKIVGNQFGLLLGLVCLASFVGAFLAVLLGKILF